MDLRNEKNPFGLYEIREGDTAASVSAEYGVLPQDIASANGFKDFPSVGNLIVIPEKAGEIYTVQAGETLASLCGKFGMSETEFCRLNNCAYVYPTQRVYIKRGKGG